MTPPLLSIRKLRVHFGAAPAVDGVDLDVAPGELLAIVGESGSGKSVTMMAALGLIDAPGVVQADALRFDGQDLLRMPARARRRIVGKHIAMVFQDALNSLNPCHTVGAQVAEVLRVQLGLRGAALRARVLQLFDAVEIPDARARVDAYPHQMSGGMNQRVMIAMAIACEPRLLIADEPTTALDVTIQAQVMALLERLQRERGMGLVLISHDLAVVASLAQRVAVMYAGQVVETGAVPQLFEAPRHPYTAALLAALPAPGRTRLQALSGVVPGAHDRPAGCLLAPRCPRVMADCRAQRPALVDGVRCFHPLVPSSMPEGAAHG